MTVAENLAFPLRNRGVSKKIIVERVGRIAEMLELSAMLDQRTAGLAADQKQKISLGRGLVRSDVSAVLFDEPLTVIDPHLKWQLRRKLKQIHKELNLTLIYVTHDQVEALTFADEVVVMSRGRVMQIGSAQALFEKPAHVFVGNFIGSPGMNFLPLTQFEGQLQVAGVNFEGVEEFDQITGNVQIGIRPERLMLSDTHLRGSAPAVIKRIQNLGSFVLVTCDLNGYVVRLRTDMLSHSLAVGATVYVQLLSEHSCIYKNEVLIA
jgi:glycerol transport system ATP-binding protein